MRIKDEELKRVGEYLDGNLRELLKQSLYLIERERQTAQSGIIVDYGFLIFTVALVYEGFLKRLFFQMQLISESQYRGDYFRIGKALNPDLPKKYQDEEYVYDNLLVMCGEGTARHLWEAWKMGRNRVFHYDFVRPREILLEEAEKRVTMMLEAMVAAVRCERQVKREDE